MEEDFVQEIEKKIRRTTFVVSGILIEDLKKFKEYCKNECNDSYAVGIVKLLKLKEDYEKIFTLFYSLQKQINEIKEKLKGGNLK